MKKKMKSPLQELFGKLKFSEPTDDLMKDIRKDLASKFDPDYVKRPIKKK